MKLSDIHARTVRSTVQVLGEDVDIELRPAMFTSEFESNVANAKDPLELAALLATLVVSIDITEPDEHGVEQRIRCDGLTFHRVLPMGIIQDVWAAVGKALRPGEVKGETSANG